MALEIHSRSGRLAFLPATDLSPSAFESAETFKNLGPLTIFVQEVSKLTFEQQNALVAYYALARDKDCPQIIAGTTLTLAELKKSCKILPALWPQLTVGFLSMTQPFETYKRENLVEFFFDSLTGRNNT